ncbi:OmpA family protein [Flavobacterium sp. MAH-1]|uniref:OmpA family protein n=1 Tax=Flavobacterium agri TaxID=2743471 RepID=A0A7Y8Y4T9_9FLAO|nr:OmpA family protein [Flavobacterium agri]NUY82447.1 OmpA family protein [Flavobacterium agri]NYA72471.1 OmpA family protein [Flavobacterium agri]
MKAKILMLLLFLAPILANAQQQFPVYFDSNKHDLKKTESARLQKWMDANQDVKIVAINGYTDEDGSLGHNDSLAQRRVSTIYKVISGKIKIREDFKTRSFGELHEHSKNKAENRKAVIYYIEAKDIPRENEILGIQPEKAPEPQKRIVTYPERITVDNPDGTKSEYKLDVEFMRQMTNATKGDKLTIANLNFVINTFAIVPESRSKLYELLLVLQRNPNLRIDIQGHLCCSPKDHTDLSTKRAKAIYQFLVMNEIEKSRLSYKGLGTTAPLFPIPEKSETERAANRRVEIEILGN